MIYFDLIGVKPLDKALGALIKRISNPAPAFKEIRKSFIASEKKLFASQGGSGANGSWDDWSNDYKDWREWTHPEAGTNKMILTGGLLDSLVGAGPGHVYELTEHEMRIGTDLPAKNGMSLGFIHMDTHEVKYPYGNTGNESMKVVGRKVIDPTMAEMNDWSQKIFSHILGGLA